MGFVLIYALGIYSTTLWEKNNYCYLEQKIMQHIK